MGEQLLLVPAEGHGRRRACAPLPIRSPPPQDRPWHSCRTNRGAASTRCPARSAGTRPAPAGPDPIACLYGSGEGGRPRIGRVPTPATTARRANRRPIGAAGIAACPTGEAGRLTRRAPLPAQRSSGNSAIVRGCPDVIVEHLDGLAPHRSLRGIDLPQVQNVALHDAAACNALVLDHAPIVVRLAVFLSWVFRRNMTRRISAVANLHLGIG